MGQYNTVSFPGLGIGEFVVKSEIEIGSISIRFYAICICLGLILAFVYCERKCEHFGLTKDDFLDLALIGVPAGLLGARVGYILMDLKSFHSFKDMIAVWNGGLSIYGGVIGAFLALAIACLIKKINIFGVFDVAAIGIIIGQIVGRWGNFFNIEVYGVETYLQHPLRMGIGVDGVVYSWVHPLFLYESVWNLVGFVLILLFLDNRKFKGEVFLWYAAWYGVGRFWMEALRDTEFQLICGSVRINQVIAAVAVIVSLVLWIYFRFFKISVHFNSDEIEKTMSFKEIREYRRQMQLEKEKEKYDSQFSAQLEEDVAIDEDEFVMKEVFEKLDQLDEE